MFRHITFAALFATALCCDSEKYLTMWNNIENAPNSTADGHITIYEIQSYFDASYSDENDIINYYSFDYTWGTRYQDDTSTTAYIFVTWDTATKDNLLDPTDLVAMYNAINTNPATPNYIDFITEFLPYFQSLYAGCCTLPW